MNGRGGQAVAAADGLALPTARQTVILGLGNILLEDDGAGVHAVSYLQQRCPHDPELRILDGGTLSYTLDVEIEQARDLIVIDAAQIACAPGTVRVYEGAQMDEFVARCKRSTVHEVSLVDLIAMATLCGHLPRQRALIGIQPRRMEWGDTLSETVRSAVEVAGQAALDLAGKWSRERQRVSCGS